MVEDDSLRDLATLAEAAGEDWTPELCAAWTEAFGSVGSTMAGTDPEDSADSGSGFDEQQLRFDLIESPAASCDGSPPTPQPRSDRSWLHRGQCQGIRVGERERRRRRSGHRRNRPDLRQGRRRCRSKRRPVGRGHLGDVEAGGLRAVIKAGNLWAGKVKNRTANENFYWVKAMVFPCFADGGVVGYISVKRKPSVEEIRSATAAYRRLR